MAPYLTPRETAIMALVARGLLNKEIGRALGISTLTVKRHLANVYDKLGVNNRTEAVYRLRCPPPV